ncbi:hypothetical protein KY358_06805 [Candidatus Woesearchaeota archaeon]|nr:hypothetical protein [Candidatus Woesearchaeota archaeon]
MFSLKQILKPNIHKLLLFLLLLVVTPSILGFSSHFIDGIGSVLRGTILFPDFFFEDFIFETLPVMVEFMIIFFFSFIIGEIIANKYKPGQVIITIEKALLWTFGTLGAAGFMASILGSGSLYWPRVLADLSKYVLLSFLLALIVESIKLRIKNTMFKTALMILFLIFLLRIAFFEASILILRIGYA